MKYLKIFVPNKLSAGLFKPIKFSILLLFLWSFVTRCAITMDNTFKGVASDNIGNPLSGVAIDLEDTEPSGKKGKHWNTTTDEHGAYIIEVDCTGYFPNGGYCPRKLTLTAEKSGYAKYQLKVTNGVNNIIFE